MKLARRMNRLGTETAFEVLVRAKELERQGQEIIHLEIGEPDFDTPANIVEAGVAALRSGATHYTPSAGTADLRAAIAKDTTTRKGFEVDPSNVVVTPGGKPIMFYLMLALLEEGDEVIYPNPGFPIYESMIDFLGARRVPIGFVPDGDHVRWDVNEAVNRAGTRTKLMIVDSPSNPVGAVLEHEDLERLADVARRHDMVAGDGDRARKEPRPRGRVVRAGGGRDDRGRRRRTLGDRGVRQGRDDAPLALVDVARRLDQAVGEEDQDRPGRHDDGRVSGRARTFSIAQAAA